MAFALLRYSVLVTVKVPESHSMYHIHSSYIVNGFPRQTHRLIVLSRVSGLAGPLMYLFPNCTALPRGQPADERLGGTIDITAVCSEARLNPAANVRYKRRGKWWGNIETAKQSLWTFGLEQFFSIVAARYSPLPGQASDSCVIFSLPTSAGLEDVLTTADISPHVAVKVTFVVRCRLLHRASRKYVGFTRHWNYRYTCVYVDYICRFNTFDS